MEITIIKSLQSLSNPFFDAFFLLCTKLGEEIFFFLLFSIVYWCFSKESAMKLGLFYIVSAGVNFVAKLLVRRPRPYVADSSIMNKRQAYGTSFPSGHSQSYALLATTTCLDIHKHKYFSKGCRRVIYVLLVIGGILVPISRMYLGQHYLTDTLAGLIIGLVVAYLCEIGYNYLKTKIKERRAKQILLGIVILGLCAIGVVYLLKVDSTSIYKYLILAVSLIAGYLIEDKYIHYQPEHDLKQSICKVCLGLLVFFGVYFPIKLLIGGAWSTYLVCMVGAVVSTILLPLMFKYLFSRRETNHGNV